MTRVEHVEKLLRNFGLVKVLGEVTEGYELKLGGTRFILLKEDVDTYQRIEVSATLEPETSLYIPSYYEHYVQVIDEFSHYISLSRPQENLQNLSLVNQDESIKVEISNISNLMIIAVYDKLEKDRRYRLLSNRGPRVTDPGAAVYHGNKHQPELRDLFSNVLTIKVWVASSTPTKYSKNTLQSIANSCLLNISISLGIATRLADSWDYGLPRNLHQFPRLQTVEFPRRLYKNELVAYYQLALSSNNAISSFLSLYKILEYFYLGTAEMTLHRRLKEKLAMPNFSHKSTNSLRELTTIIRKFDQRTNEQQMLVGVLENYFMFDELAIWLSNTYHPSKEYYVTKQDIFGVQFKVELNQEQIFSSLARRIYHVRNAIVHNKEGESTSFIPFTDQEEILNKELPLLFFLAEQLIIKTGEDL